MNMDRLLCKAKALVECDTYCDKGDWVTGYPAPNSFDQSDFVIVIKWESGMGGIRIPVETSTICQIAPKTISMKTPVFENDLIEMMGETYKVELLCDHWILRLMNTDEDAYLHLSTIGFDYKVIGNALNKENQ